jgi:hypothetical protein
MEQIPTAKEIYLSKVFPTSFENRRDEVELWFEISPDAQQSVEIMIEFAKLHVEQALKEALESIPCLGSSSDIATYEEVEYEVLNSYPLSNIK